MLDTLKTAGGIGVVVGIVAIMVFSPFALIWGVNTICEQSNVDFNIPYNFWTWLSALAIAFVTNSNSGSSK